MFGIGMRELLIILFIGILLFGASRIPEIAKALGKSLGSFKKGLKDTDDEVKKLDSVDKEEKEEKEESDSGDK